MKQNITLIIGLILIAIGIYFLITKKGEQPLPNGDGDGDGNAGDATYSVLTAQYS